MKSGAYADSINAHYGASELAGAIGKGLVAVGKGDAVLTPDDLAPVDQFHSRGKEATLELMDFAGVKAGSRVLDVGGGIGGAARLLASECGARVTVVDLTEDFCLVGAALTARAALSGRVDFRHGNALELPFQDATFDLVWTQHSTMNIADKAALFCELARVTARGGRVAMHEIVAGPEQPVHFPVPWARTPDLSFLVPPDEFRALAAGAGLLETGWRDTSAESLEWFRARAAAMRAAAESGRRPPLGLHLILGDDFPVMFANQVRNLEERRVFVVMGTWSRA
jgi:SAM-dependent methyltransferase